MLLQLLFSNTAYFALTLLSALVFSSAGLVYFDSWQVNKQKKSPLWRGIGFLLLGVVSIFYATSIQNPNLVVGMQIVKTLGLAIILLSLINEPLLNLPAKKSAALVYFSLIPLSGALMLLIAFSYFRKVTEGLEKQLKPVVVAFLLLGIAEISKNAFYWSGTTNVYWSKLLTQFGPWWSLQHVFDFLGVVILGTWVWGYIRFRLKLQIFVMTMTMSLIFFLSITVFFTFLLLKNLENDALAHLKTDINVLQYSLDSLQDRILAQTKAIAQNSSLQQAFVKLDNKSLFTLTSDYLRSQQSSTLVLASTTGQVVIRAEDSQRTNDNVGSDPLIKSALSGIDVKTIGYTEGITVPEVSVKAAVPIMVSGKIVGAVVSGFAVDSTFVDGVKSATGLDIAVFGNDKRAATTFLAPDGKSRFVGTMETNPRILENVLKKGQIYVGKASVLNQPFYTAYAPLKAYDGSIIGMLFVGRLQNTLTEAAKQSINLTFAGSVILILISIIPVYLLARFLQEHAEA